MNNIVLSATLALKHENSVKPADWILDKIAEEKMTGGYNCKKSNICKVCNITRYANGSCDCD